MATTRTAAPPTATGGAGGDADSGNTQVGNGNQLYEGDGENVLLFAGDTEAESGDAEGGDGGEADADGGVAVAVNTAIQTPVNVADVPADDDVALAQENDATLVQGGNTARGGDATANGGAGGDAGSGNTQVGGNPVSTSRRSRRSRSRASPSRWLRRRW